MQINTFTSPQFDAYKFDSDVCKDTTVQDEDVHHAETNQLDNKEHGHTSKSFKMKSSIHSRCIEHSKNKVYGRPSESASSSIDKPKVIPRFRKDGFQIGDFPTFYKTDKYLLSRSELTSEMFAKKRTPEGAKLITKIERMNSLFLNRSDFTLKDRVGILSAANNMLAAKEKDKKRFSDAPTGVTKPVVDKGNKVIFKSSKNPDIHAFSTVIRDIMISKRLKNIILPTREMWREKSLSKETSSSIFVENLIDDVFDTNTSFMLYKEFPQLFNKSIKDLVELFLEAEVCDTCLDEKRYKDNLEKSKKSECLKKIFPVGCYCNFSNLLLKKIKDSEGNISIKFVLVDLDIVKMPTRGTILRLIKMFPKHKSIIKSIVDRDNPGVFDSIDQKIEVPEDPITCDFSYTEKELRESYKLKLSRIPKPEVKKDIEDKEKTEA